jgi:hypothetical protein
VTTTAERLGDTVVTTDSALVCVDADSGASPVLIAVMGEFAKKADRATRSGHERTAFIELEQAGDSTKAAAEADLRRGRHTPSGAGHARSHRHWQSPAVT